MTHMEWSQILERLRESIDQATAEAIRFEETAPAVESVAESRLDRLEQHIARFGARLEDYQSQVERASRDAQQAEDALAEHEVELRQFRQAIQTSREQLAKVPGGV